MAVTAANLEQRLDKEILTVVKRSNIDKRFYPELNKLTYANFLTNRILIVMVIRHGIPYSFFNLIQHYTPFSETDWANLLDLSTKSLQRYKQSSKLFRPLQSEKIIEMAEVTHVGLDVFGSMERFKSWLDTPSYPLGNLKPIELLGDSYGKELVISELTRINHGIFV